METRANYVAVGAFVVIILTGVVVMVLWLARVEFNREFALYDIYFTGSVTGLTQGSAVLYNGIQVGRVTEIRIDPQNLQQVRVTIEVDQPALIKSDAVASLEMQGLTGVAFIEISGGSQSSPPLIAQPGQRYPVITSQQSGLQRLASTAPEALARLVDLADRLSALFDEQNRAAIAETLDNVRRLTAVAAGRAGDMDSAIGDAAATMRDLRATVAAAHQSVVELQQMVGKDGPATATLQSADQAARKLDRLADELDAVVKENRQPLRTFSERGLNQLSLLLTDARTLVNQLTRLTDQISRNPSQLLFGSPREGYQPR